MDQLPTGFNAHRPKIAISHHKQDHCDTCSKLNAQVYSKRTSLNGIRQSGSASVGDQQDLEAEIKELERQHTKHIAKKLNSLMKIM